MNWPTDGLEMSSREIHLVVGFCRSFPGLPDFVTLGVQFCGTGLREWCLPALLD